VQVSFLGCWNEAGEEIPSFWEQEDVSGQKIPLLTTLQQSYISSHIIIIIIYHLSAKYLKFYT
jgi:hypothetical protein